MNTKILVCCHKQDIYAKESPYVPIQVGKAKSSVDLGIQGDNTGDNISEKNASYCELTGMYWAWKNLKDVDVIGLCHYRRYFDFYNQGRKGFPSTSFKSKDFDKLNITIPDDILNRVRQGEVVVAKHRNFRFSLFQEYCESHISDDIRTLNIIIQNTQPQEIKDAFFKVVYQGNRLCHYNMFLMTWKMFDEYCSWLFPLLEQVEDAIDISYYNPIQKRIFGYMAERLFNVWLYAKGAKLIEKPILWINDGDDLLSLYSQSRYKLRVLTNDISHFFSKPRQ